MLGTGYFLKIAKSNSQHEKPICPNRKLAKQKIVNPQKLTLAKISCHTVSVHSCCQEDCAMDLSSLYVLFPKGRLCDKIF